MEVHTIVRMVLCRLEMVKYDEKCSIKRAELGMYPLKTNGDVTKLQWSPETRNMPRGGRPYLIGLYGRKTNG